MYRARRVAGRSRRAWICRTTPPWPTLAASAALEVSSRSSVNGHDVTHAIRTPEIDRAAAVVARHPQPSEPRWCERQRAYGRDGGVVMEGRDIGSVVFPERRREDLSGCVARRTRAAPARATSAHAIEPGRRRELATVADALAARDSADRTRAVSPLTRADDAIYIDTTGIPIDDVVARVMAIVRRRRRLAS